MQNPCHDPGKDGGNARKSYRTEQPLFAFVPAADIRHEFLRSRDDPRRGMTDPPFVHKKPIHEIENRENPKNLEKSSQKAARIVDGIRTYATLSAFSATKSISALYI